MNCAYRVLSELQFNTNILNLRHAGKVDHEHPITGMLRYFALIKRARHKPNQSSELLYPMPNSETWGAILQKVAADKGIELPNNDELELALYDQLGPPKDENRLPSPFGSFDAQSESDHSSDEEPVPTALSEDEVEEEPDLPAPRINSPPKEPPPLCEEQAKIIDQGIDVWHFAPNAIIRPKILDHQNMLDYDREGVLKQCPKRLLRCLRHEVSGSNIAMQPGGWVPVSEAIRGLTEEFTEYKSQSPKRDVLCVLEYANQGILPDSIEPYPRIQVKCVQRGFSPDNLEIPERMTNALGINMEHFIPFYGSKIPCAITHMRAGHRMTRKEGRNAPVPQRMWYLVHDRLDPGRRSNTTT